MNVSLVGAWSLEGLGMFVIVSLIILVSSLNIISALIMLVCAKTRDMAILRTIGALRDAVMRIFMAIGLSIGVAGTIAGLTVGFSLLYFRQGVLRGVEFLTGQPLWDPSIRLDRKSTRLNSSH